MDNIELDCTFRPFTEENDKSIYAIIGVVVLLHAVLIGCSLWIGPSPVIPKPSQPPRFVVQTIDINPRSESIAMTSHNTKVEQPIIKPQTEPPKEPEPIITSEPEPMPEPELGLKPVREPESVPLAEPQPKAEVKPKAPVIEKVPPKPSPKKTETPKAPPKKPVPVKKDPVTPKVSEKPKPKPSAPPKVEPKKAVEEKKTQQAAAEQKKRQEAEAQKKKEIEAQKKKEGELQAERVRQQKLLAQAQEKIAKIAKSGDKVSPSRLNDTDLAAAPKSITSLQIDGLSSNQEGPAVNDREMTYRHEVASRLKLQLRLPEYGDVRVKLTLDRTGKVVSVVIVSAESAANKKYIEKALPEMTFPAFGNNFESATQYTFSITLSNEL